MSGSYYNDKKKLADAIALAKSFSKAKPAKSCGNSARPARASGAGRLHSGARQQLTQSVVRLGSLNPAAKISHRQLPQSVHTRRQASMSMAAWQAQKDAPSITGGLDFLNRKYDAPAVTVQPKATPMPALPDISNPGQSLPVSVTPVAAPTKSVLDEFLTLMAQLDLETAQVDPLVDKLQKWNLQSPDITKSKTVTLAATPVSDPAMPKAVLAPRTTIPLGEVSNLPGTPWPEMRSTTLFEPTNVPMVLPPTPKQEDKGQPVPEAIEQLVAGPQTPKLSQGNVVPAMKPRNGLTASRFASKEIENFKPQQHESRVAFGATEHLVRPPQTSEPARCNCSPTIKPQKGLAASRFASRETGSFPFANRFSVNMQIAIHQEFCPLSEQNGLKTSKGAETKKVPKALRAEAEPFTPKSARKLIDGSGV